MNVAKVPKVITPILIWLRAYSTSSTTTTAASRSINGEVSTMWRIQRMFFAHQPPRRLAKTPDLEALHAEGLHHAVAAQRFLENLVQFAEARLAGLDRAANAPAELAHRPEHHRDIKLENSVILQLVTSRTITRKIQGEEQYWKKEARVSDSACARAPRR